MRSVGGAGGVLLVSEGVRLSGVGPERLKTAGASRGGGGGHVFVSGRGTWPGR